MKIRQEPSSAQVTVIDDDGYAVAQFYYQAGANGIPRNDALALAKLFIEIVAFLANHRINSELKL